MSTGTQLLKAYKGMKFTAHDLCTLGYKSEEASWIITMRNHWVQHDNNKDRLNSYCVHGNPSGHTGGTMNYTMKSLIFLENGRTDGAKEYRGWVG